MVYCKIRVRTNTGAFPEMSLGGTCPFIQHHCFYFDHVATDNSYSCGSSYPNVHANPSRAERVDGGTLSIYTLSVEGHTHSTITNCSSSRTSTDHSFPYLLRPFTDNDEVAVGPPPTRGSDRILIGFTTVPQVTV